MKYLIVGLGNIGPEYELTRHNIGFLVLDQFADKNKADFKNERLAYKTEVKIKGKVLHLIKPTTYMNLSGKAVNYWMQQLGVTLEHVLVIVDDVALPFGKLRLRAKGSSAGHNGLKNIEATLGTQNYARLKFGIGDDFPKGRQADYVLSNFNKDEFKEIQFPIAKACDMIASFCLSGIDKTMADFNE